MLFRAGPAVHLNACVGENGGPYDLVDYGRGFFEGAQEIIHGLRNGRSTVDLVIYPICFSFRHGIELYLKAIIKAADAFNQSKRKYNKNNSIDEYWKLIVAEFEKFDDRVIDRTSVGIVGDIIADFVQIDPTGQVFRYPEDIKGNAHLIGLQLINVEVLSDGMHILHELLSSWYYRLEGVIDERCDARS